MAGRGLTFVRAPICVHCESGVGVQGGGECAEGMVCWCWDVIAWFSLALRFECALGMS